MPVGRKSDSVACDVALAQMLPVTVLLVSPRVKGAGQTVSKMEVTRYLTYNVGMQCQLSVLPYWSQAATPGHLGHTHDLGKRPHGSMNISRARP